MHCYEWEDLNKPEYLSLVELITALKTFQDYGVSQVHLSGGEPLNCFYDLVGHFLSPDVNISEDHYRIPEQFYLNLNTPH